MVVYGNAAFVAEFGDRCVGLPAREGMLGLPADAFAVLDAVFASGRPLARWIRRDDEEWRITAAPASTRTRPKPTAWPSTSAPLGHPDPPSRLIGEVAGQPPRRGAPSVQPRAGARPRRRPSPREANEPSSGRDVPRPSSDEVLPPVRVRPVAIVVR